MQPAPLKLAASLVLLTLAMSAGPCLAAPLSEKSNSPDWGRASQAEKDAWIAAFHFTKPDAKKADVVTCLDQYALKPLFESNDLSGVTQMCESIAALPQ